ncbi:hypothetical protein A7X85_45045 [Streptomyces sp. ST1015]|nr:hypothetical protein [Streptomyces sp. ST1020]QZZ32410.1 hypothetical protein A7X85_45045 [Streptomyces sp. ST1015]
MRIQAEAGSGNLCCRLIRRRRAVKSPRIWGATGTCGSPRWPVRPCRRLLT